MLLCCYVAMLLSPSVHAQENDWVFGGDDPIKTQGEAIDACEEKGELSADCMVQFNLDKHLVAALCSTGGIGCTANPEKAEEFRKGSALGQMGNLIATLYTPPASSVYYAYDLLHNAGLVPKAYAQGIGFSGLSPILGLWKMFRNISYMLLVVFLIIIGLMVMFRMKIDPQTVISVQNALPRIAVTLLLITFSYAIAGFMIDLMYLAILLVIALLGQGGAIPAGATEVVQGRYLTEGLRNLFGGVFGAGTRGIDDIVKLLTGGWLADFSWGIGWIARAVLGVIVSLFVVIALLFVSVKIFLALLNSYIQVILAIIFAPFQLVFGALPGQNPFGGWLKGLIANLIVFPATAAILILAMFFTTQNVKIWTPPMLSSTTGGGVTGLIGLGLVLFIPTLLDKIKEMFAAKPTMPMGLGTIMGPTTGGVMNLLQLAGTLRTSGVWPTKPAPAAEKK